MRVLVFAETGRQSERIEDSIPAFVELAQRHDDLELVVLGSGFPENVLRAHFPEPLQPRIRLLQTKSYSENANIMANFVPIRTRSMVDALERLPLSREMRAEIETNADEDPARLYIWNGSTRAVDRPFNLLFALHASRDTLTAVYKNTLDRANYLRAHGHRCTVLTPDDFPWMKYFRGRFIPLLYPPTLALWLLCQRKEFDVAVFHSYAGWVVSALKNLVQKFQRMQSTVIFHGLEPIYFERLRDEMQRAGKPLSWHYRLISGKLMLKLLRFATRRADLALCLNIEEALFLINTHWAEPCRTRVVGNPAPEEFFITRDYRDPAVRLLFVGQWLPMKGTRYLADAFARLHEKHPELRLCCAGTMAPREQVLESFAPELRELIDVYPRVDSQELLELHRRSDVFVLPTVSEGFSLALIEAMASGLPIVTTRVGAAPDILNHEISAMLIPAQNSTAINNAIDRLIGDFALRQRLGRAAQQAAENFRHESTWRSYAVCFKPSSGSVSSTR